MRSDPSSKRWRFAVPLTCAGPEYPHAEMWSISSSTSYAKTKDILYFRQHIIWTASLSIELSKPKYITTATLIVPGYSAIS